MPQTKQKIKYLKANQTRYAINQVWFSFKENVKYDHTVTFAQKYGQHFETESSKHTEWRPQQIEEERSRIERMIQARRTRRTCPTCARYGETVTFTTDVEFAAHLKEHPLAPEEEPQSAPVFAPEMFDENGNYIPPKKAGTNA